MTTRLRSIVLWVLENDPPSTRASGELGSIRGVIPRSIQVWTRVVSPANEVTYVPTLEFRLNSQVVFSLVGDITAESILAALRKLDNA